MREPHAVVKLLVARMESHPEEFGPKGDQRWLDYLHQMDGMLTEEERLMLRSNRMQEIHEGVMEELLNGPASRRMEEVENEYERNLTASVRHMKQQQLHVSTASSDMNPIRSILK